MYALEIQRPYALDYLRIRLARDPAERLVDTTIGQHHPRIILRDPRNQAHRIRQVGSLRRHNERRIHPDRHRQLAPCAIVDDAAFRREIEAALLLMLRAPLEISVAKNLQVNQPQADRQQPQAQQSRQSINPESCAVRSGTRRHFQSSETFGGPEEPPSKMLRAHSCPAHNYPGRITAPTQPTPASRSPSPQPPGRGPNPYAPLVRAAAIVIQAFSPSHQCAPDRAMTLLPSAALDSSLSAHRAAFAASRFCTHIQSRGNVATHIPSPARTAGTAQFQTASSPTPAAGLPPSLVASYRSSCGNKSPECLASTPYSGVEQRFASRRHS